MANTDDREAQIEDKDVEGHGLVDSPNVDSPSIEETDDGDDVEAHGLIDSPNVDSPNVD